MVCGGHGLARGKSKIYLIFQQFFDVQAEILKDLETSTPQYPLPLQHIFRGHI